jgi:hypothetical protein
MAESQAEGEMVGRRTESGPEVLMLNIEQLDHDDAATASELVGRTLKTTGLSRAALRAALPRAERYVLYDPRGPWPTTTPDEVAAATAANLLIRMARDVGVPLGGNTVLGATALGIARELLDA